MPKNVVEKPANMIFAFRGIRMYQVFLVLIALATGVGTVLAIKVFVDSRALLMLPAAILLGLTFMWTFGGALRAPTSFVAVTAERTRIRFPNGIDRTIENRDVLGARMVHRNMLGGIGIRTNFGGDVALVTTWGDVVELTLRNPVRVWLIPRLIPLRATRLTLSLKNAQKLVERFGAPEATTSASSKSALRKTRQRGSRTR
ncbi:MAG: hypothetical protein ACRDG3_12490 [Tepidiformaceae bacterium]